MFKLLALFAIATLSLASSNGWVGTWNATNSIGDWNCGVPFPVSTFTITVGKSNTLVMKGLSNRDIDETWTLPWTQYNTTGTDCYKGAPACTLGDLEIHGNDAHGEIKWYCGGYTKVGPYEGITFSIVKGNEVPNEGETSFLSA